MAPNQKKRSSGEELSRNIPTQKSNFNHDIDHSRSTQNNEHSCRNSPSSINDVQSNVDCPVPNVAGTNGHTSVHLVEVGQFENRDDANQHPPVSVDQGENEDLNEIINAEVVLNVSGHVVADDIIEGKKLSLRETIDQSWSCRLLLATISIISLASVVTLVLLLSGVFKKAPQNVQIDELKRSIAIEVSGEDVFEDIDSPQSKALRWLQNDDKIEINSEQKFRFVQRYILTVIYYSTGGPTTWKNGDLYLNSSRHECDWSEYDYRLELFRKEGQLMPDRLYNKGYHCRDNKTQTISDIRLYYLNMSGTIPREIGLLSDLVVVSMGGNPNVHGTIPSEIGKLSSLQELYFFDMNLTGSLPKEVEGLTDLTMMFLYENQDLSDDLEHICQIDSLVWLQADCGNGTSKKTSSCCNSCCNLDIHKCCLVNDQSNCWSTDPNIIVY